MANADTKTKTKKKKEKAEKRVPVPEPKHSKAARRFYNQNFRESQRLSKVLAAAGGRIISIIISNSSSFMNLIDELHCRNESKLDLNSLSVLVTLF